MNYRHAYHAGNFADVVKHAVLALVLQYMQQKAKPLRVIDTHAGIGSYDLTGAEAGKTGEWHDGIGRLLGPDATAIPAGVAELLSPYLDVVRACNPEGGITRYPGSPRIARAMLRAGDTLIVNELHPADHATLAAQFAGDRHVKVMALDAWVAVKALLPPPERRGVILIDPPYEAKDEFERLAKGLGDAVSRFATGTYLLWYPVKGLVAADMLNARVAELGIGKTLRIELHIRRPNRPDRLDGCGILVVNPPWTLAAQLTVLLPFLRERLAQGPGAGWRLEPGRHAEES